MMSEQKIRLVACPTCKQLVAFSAENIHRPFCSKRCEMIDLGSWATEQYAIPENNSSDPTIDDSLQ